MEMWCIFTQDEVTPGQRRQSGLHCNYCTRYSVPLWNYTVCNNLVFTATTVPAWNWTVYNSLV